MNCQKLKLLFCLLLLPLIHYGQTSEIKKDVISEIQKLMVDNYIFLDKAKATNAHLASLLKTDSFEDCKDPVTFAKALSSEMQKITKDKHLNIAPPPPPPQPNQEREEVDFISRHLTNIERFRKGGFGKIDLLEGNVGYIELKGFRREDIPKVDAVMDYFNTADALIIDLRENGGGNSLGLYLSSYFLEENIALSGLYERRTDAYSELKTTKVKGQKRLDMPIYILTSSFTFSAAEAFAYDLQARKRVVIVGENTGGGAHPVNFMRLPHGYGIIMPYARSINPVTKTNWEGVGVSPDVLTTKDEALDKALKLAIKDARTYREAPFLQLKSFLEAKDISTADEMKIQELLALILSRKHLEDFMINDMGYTYLENKQMRAALTIFKANTNLFPHLPNVHDSYAEALAQNGYNQKAREQYQQAISLAEKQKDQMLELYRKNMAKFEASLNP